ncbi:MAG: hypothetical protein V1875_04825 [Candidatus Altiarchaeota archaeon]
MRINLSAAAVLYLLTAAATSTSIEGITLSKNKIDFNEQPDIVVELDGDTCGGRAEFYLDDQFFGERGLGCGFESITAYLHDPAHSQWSGLRCGTHLIKVKIFGPGGLFAEDEVPLEMTSPGKIVFDPYPPSLSHPFSILLRDNKTNLQIVDWSAKIGRHSPAFDSSYSSDENGIITASLPTSGIYTIEYESRRNCGETSFYAYVFPPTTTSTTTTTTGTTTSTLFRGRYSSPNYSALFQSEYLGQGSHESANYRAEFEVSYPEYSPPVSEGLGGGGRRYCGDSVCSLGEDCKKCPKDCGSCDVTTVTTNLAFSESEKAPETPISSPHETEKRSEAPVPESGIISPELKTAVEIAESVAEFPKVAALGGAIAAAVTFIVASLFIFGGLKKRQKKRKGLSSV